jgi:hypothetical protein
VLQVTCPYFYDETVPATVSNIYYCTDPTLTGSTLISATTVTPNSGWNPCKDSGFKSNWFNAATLVALKVSARYIGRADAISGFWGASYNVVALNPQDVDPNASLFNYVNRSTNAVVTPVIDGVNCIFLVFYFIN